MEEIGRILKEKREENSVSLLEVASDLEIEYDLLENLESGNSRAFKDFLELKDIVLNYAKYLGLAQEDISNKFNDFVFEHTSKICLNDIDRQNKELNKKKEAEGKEVFSPYTKPKKIESIKEYRKDYKIAFLVFILLLIVILLFVIRIIIITKEEKKINSYRREYNYEKVEYC